MFSVLFQACLQAKQSLVIDNTNPTKEDRQRYIPRAKSHKFKVIGYYFDCALDDCLARNSYRRGESQIPERGIKATFSKLEVPAYDEGFDELYFVENIWPASSMFTVGSFESLQDNVDLVESVAQGKVVRV